MLREAISYTWYFRFLENLVGLCRPILTGDLRFGQGKGEKKIFI